MRITSELLMSRETVYLSIIYLDSYTQLIPISKTQYKLVALASLLIAYKQEKRHIGQQQFIEVIIAYSGNGYTREQIASTERNIAVALEFHLTPTTHQFWLEYFTLRWDRFV
jgi:hypothetical protein